MSSTRPTTLKGQSMRARRGTVLAAVTSSLASAALTLLAPAAAQAAAATPPYEPDASSIGTLAFYDASGLTVTGGSTTATPFAKYAVGTYSSSATLSGTSGVLYGCSPKSGQAPGNWSCLQMNAATPFPIAGAPAPVAGASPATQINVDDYTLDQLAQAYPNTATDPDPYTGLYQLRLGTTTDAKYLVADVKITGSTWQLVYPAPPSASLPDAPTGLQATYPATGSVALSWTAGASNGGASVTDHQITVTPSGGSAQTVMTGSGTTSYTLNGLSVGTTYDVTVAAVNSAGTGAASSPLSVSPVSVATAPAPPTGVSAVAGDTKATVSFTPGADNGSAITSYTVVSSQGDVASGSTSPIVVTGLANGVSRTFTVSATNGVGTSDPSAASAAVVFYGSAVSIRTSTALITAGGAATLSGTLTSGPTGSARAVRVYSYPVGKTASYVTLSTATTGAWSRVVKPVYNTAFRVVYLGDATHKAVTSAAVKVTVRTKLTIVSPTYGAKTTHRTITVTGRTGPNKAGAYVYLYEVRSTGLVKLAAARVSSTGSFTFIRTFTKGTHVLQVRIGATTSNASGISPNVRFYEV